MRKSLWIMLAVFAAAVSAPNAHADTDEFQYTYTVTAPSSDTFSWETVPIPGVTAEVDLPLSSLASATITASNPAFEGCSITSVVLDLGGAGDQKTSFSICGVPPGLQDTFNLPLTDYTTPGTYSFSTTNPDFIQSATLEVSAVATTPEPSSVALMLLGVGLVLVMRKR